MAEYIFTPTTGNAVPIDEGYSSATGTFYRVNSTAAKTYFSMILPGNTYANSAAFEAIGSLTTEGGLRIKQNGNDWALFTEDIPYYVGIFCYKKTSANVPGYCVIAVPGASEEGILSYVHAGSFNYNNEVVPFISEVNASDYVSVDYEWDETPTTNPDDLYNILPDGGEYADTGLFNETDTVDLASMGYLENDTDIVFDYSSFLTHYVLTPSNMAALGTAIFLPDFWQSLDNKFAGLSDPMNLIVSAVELPFSYNDTATYFQMGGVTVAPSAGQTIACFKTSTRYRSFYCGSRTIREVWGSAKDYTDVQVQLYLPYCGVKELDPDLVINHTVTIRANVDMITGDLVYLVETSNAGLQGTYFQQTSIPYRFTGNCGKQVPIGRFDNSNAILGAIGLMVGAAAGGIGMAAGAGAAAAAGASATAGTAAEAAGLIGGGLSFLQHGLQARANTSGGVSGTYGVMDVKYPFMIIKRSVPKYPNGWRDTIGAPRYQTFSGTDMHGFTLFSDIHLPGVPGLTDEEMLQLERELKTEGVIL